MRDCDWKGSLKLRFRWLHLRREWGRYCFITDCTGETLASWWEWENP